MTDTFWTQINADLDRIEQEKPSTYHDVVKILGTPGLEVTAAPGFFAGGGGDRSLFSALSVAGWRRTWIEAEYYYVAQHPESGDVLTYCEGDVYPGDVAIH